MECGSAGRRRNRVPRILMLDDPPRLLDPLFRDEPMLSVFSDTARLQAMLDFEAALARAEAKVGMIPESAAGHITARCRADLFDRGQLAREAGAAGNIAIPMISALSRLVSESDPKS